MHRKQTTCQSNSWRRTTKHVCIMDTGAHAQHNQLVIQEMHIRAMNDELRAQVHNRFLQSTTKRRDRTINQRSTHRGRGMEVEEKNNRRKGTGTRAKNAPPPDLEAHAHNVWYVFGTITALSVVEHDPPPYIAKTGAYQTKAFTIFSQLLSRVTYNNSCTRHKQVGIHQDKNQITDGDTNQSRTSVSQRKLANKHQTTTRRTRSKPHS